MWSDFYTLNAGLGYDPQLQDTAALLLVSENTDHSIGGKEVELLWAILPLFGGDAEHPRHVVYVGGEGRECGGERGRDKSPRPCAVKVRLVSESCCPLTQRGDFRWWHARSYAASLLVVCSYGEESVTDSLLLLRLIEEGGLEPLTVRGLCGFHPRLLLRARSLL